MSGKKGTTTSVSTWNLIVSSGRNARKGNKGITVIQKEKSESSMRGTFDQFTTSEKLTKRWEKIPQIAVVPRFVIVEAGQQYLVHLLQTI